MKTDLILICLFSLFARDREVKVTWALDSHVIFCGDRRTG